MPRKSIKVVSLDPPEQIEPAKTEEPDERTTVINEINSTDPPAEPAVLDVEEAVVKKTRAKRTTSKEPIEKSVVVKAPRPKKASKASPVEETVEMVPPVQAVQIVEPVEYIEPVEAKKQVEKATCEKCGKNMSAKTLRYNHKYSCKAGKDEQINVNTAVNIPEEVIENEIQKRMQNQRKSKLEARQKQLEALVVNAF